MNTARMGGHPCARARLIREWQDLRAVRDLRASDGENALWWQDVRAVHSPTALCRAFRMHSTHILPKLAVFEYIQAICCHEPVLFSSEAPSGTHRGDILPWPAARERIGAQSRHPGTGEVRRAVSAGGWASPREGHGHLRMTNYPRQRKGSQLTPPSPQDKGRRAHCSPSFAVLFTARVAPGPSR